MKQMPLEIRCEGNSQIGFGHIRRSLTLAQKFRTMGVSVSLNGVSDEATTFLKDFGEPGPQGKSEIVLFDVPTGIESELNEIRKSGRLTVTLDWFGEVDADINIVIYPHHEVRARKQAFMGFDYVMIRDDVATLRTKFELKEDFQKVMVCLGGGDLLGQGFEVSTLLAESGLQVTLVQGPLTKGQNKAQNFDVVHNPIDYPFRMKSADWLVTNGGGCLFESMCLYKPTFILPQTEWEREIGNTVLANEAAIGMGLENLERLRLESLNACASTAGQFVDGRGAERIVNIVKSYL